MLPALDRMPQVRRLVERKTYFVIHAPRQTGKTTVVKALAREINAKGEMIALYCTLETLQKATDPARAATAIAGLLQSNAEKVFPQYFESREDSGLVCEEAAPYAQHTEATGQVFKPEVLAKVWEFTRGQPWLVNALARECVEEIHNSDKPWNDRLYTRDETFDGKIIHVVGL